MPGLKVIVERAFKVILIPPQYTPGLNVMLPSTPSPRSPPPFSKLIFTCVGDPVYVVENRPTFGGGWAEQESFDIGGGGAGAGRYARGSAGVGTGAFTVTCPRQRSDKRYVSFPCTRIFGAVESRHTASCNALEALDSSTIVQFTCVRTLATRLTAKGPVGSSA